MADGFRERMWVCMKPSSEEACGTKEKRRLLGDSRQMWLGSRMDKLVGVEIHWL